MKKIIIYTDGASRGNPGPAAIGVVFCNEKGNVIKKYAEFIGGATNNEAEYQACIFALKKFKHLFSKKIAKQSNIEVKVDSELLAKQMNGKYKIENERIQPLFLKLWNLRLDFAGVRFKHLKREKNKEADRLANEALNAELNTKKLI